MKTYIKLIPILLFVLMISCTEDTTAPTQGTIEGKIILADRNGDVEDVDITAGDTTEHPDSLGNYLISIEPGFYDVTASLESYIDSTIVGVEVIEGQSTTGIDFILNREINLEIGIIPGTQTISVGQSAVYSVSIEDAKNLFAISVEIVFDNSLISIPDVDPVIIGDFWDGNANLQGWFFEEPGILSVAIGLEGTGGITGDGALFTFELNADAIGTSDIVFQNLSLIDQNGNLIEGFNDIVFENGELIIQ